MFFKAMPIISYKTNGETILTRDIFRRVGLDKILNNSLTLESYYLQDGETPDILANNLYGSSNFHWVILTVNDITNPKKEWPKRREEPSTYIENKYGASNILKANHYRLTSDISIIVDYDAGLLANGEIEIVTNTDYEIDENEKKRQIFILRKQFLATFVTKYKSLMSQ